MDRSTTFRTSEMSHVSPRLGIRASEITLTKYKFQKYRLFHRFDEGIALDDVCWYSVTPEKIAAHIAQRFHGHHVILDLFGGAGGNGIQFALNGAFVICVENCMERIKMAKWNAMIYGVEEWIEFVCMDVYEFLKRGLCPVDAVFLSPPWGGPQYLEKNVFDVEPFKKIVELARAVCENVAILVPRNVDVQSVEKWFGACEMEKNYLGGKLKTITIYFGGLIKKE